MANRISFATSTSAPLPLPRAASRCITSWALLPRRRRSARHSARTRRRNVSLRQSRAPAHVRELNANARDPNVDYVMLGCPHAALEQIQEACRLLAGRKISANCRLWIFTSRVVREAADRRRLITKIIRDAGGPRADGHVLGDRPSAAAGNEGRGARLREASPLPARDHGNPGMVRRYGGLHRRSDRRDVGMGSCDERAPRSSCAGAK